METHRRKTEQLLYHTISDGLYDEVWVEWNGLQPLSTLLSFFPKTMLQDTGTPGDLCALRRILFVAQGAGLAELLAQTGGLLTEQLLNADVVVLRGVQNRAALSGLRAAIHSANPAAAKLSAHWKSRSRRRCCCLRWLAVRRFACGSCLALN